MCRMNCVSAIDVNGVNTIQSLDLWEGGEEVCDVIAPCSLYS